MRFLSIIICDYERLLHYREELSANIAVGH